MREVGWGGSGVGVRRGLTSSFPFCPLPPYSPQMGTADAEIKVPYVEHRELTNILPLKPLVGQNIAIHASPTARNVFLVLIST